MDAVGADALILLETSTDPFHYTSVRASMGALFWHSVVSASFEHFAAWARQYGYTVYGTSAHGSTPYDEIGEYLSPRVLLLGSERQGLSPEQAAVCQHLVRLPMQGKVTSLNLAVAAGIMLYRMLPEISH
jgi:TrmH family RNA methyltransferase